ncbi:hypothetical protein ABVT39_006968 [Epinephelus coioides]
MDYYGGRRVKKEERGDEEEGACGWSEDMAREFARAACEAKERLREATVKMASDAGMTPSSAARGIPPRTRSASQGEAQDGTKHAAGGAQQHSWGSQAPLPSEAEDDTGLELVVAVGCTCNGDRSYVPATVEGVPCLALVDTGSTVTLARPDVVPAWTPFELTAVELRTVTGELAPLKGLGRMTVTVGGCSVCHPVWIAAVQDLCILGRDFLKATGCQLDLGRGTARFQGGPMVTLLPGDTPIMPPVRLATTAVSTVESVVSNPPSLPLPMATPTGVILTPPLSV